MSNHNKKKVIEHYNELGERIYDLRYAVEQQEKYKVILNEIEKIGLILDNGCGTGLLLPYIDDDLVGIDISSVLLGKAKKRKKENQHLVNGDSEHLPFKNSTFDSVISVTVIQNLISPRKFTVEGIRVVKPGSTIIISSLKRVHSKEKISKLIKNDKLCVKKIFTYENIHDWIIVSTKKISIK
jgi:ubiquinone/menaquinone biosynthesis C-methylase UbiE